MAPEFKGRTLKIVGLLVQVVLVVFGVGFCGCWGVGFGGLGFRVFRCRL